MAEITAGMVRELRDKTDAPMMECKKALAEAAGDIGRAEELLRIRLGNRASKAAGRTAAEGVVVVHISPDAKLGAIVEINCETDFVARNDAFLAFVAELARLVAQKNPADAAALLALPFGAGPGDGNGAGATVEEARKALAGKVGENVSIRRFARMEAAGRLAQYVHGGAKIGVLLDMTGGDEQMARDLAMHIAASKPVALSRDDVPAELVQKERNIASAKAAESGKPPNIVEKMVEGSVQKFLKEVTLLGQPFVKDDKLTIEALLISRGASISRFVLYVVGEGIEKKSGD